MNNELNSLFARAVELPPDERPAFLAANCPDTNLRLEVESLLRYATGSDTLFAAAVHDVAVSWGAEGKLSPGERVGAYDIVSLIGHGGMGTVYLAERADGTFQQQVALKVLQSGTAQPLLQHFWRERRILALLNHPNIAHILDAGQTSSGSPWFVMEYVPGQTIDRFCETQILTLNATLELFLKVCDAVRHAHQGLIVHRDIKPANILVTPAGEPKLLDFGIAKVLDPANLNTASTRLLTPEYASPEQIRGDPITTATDIYSLGAVLYKLITGRPPHSLSEEAPLNAARIITEAEVPAASTVRPGVPADIDSILRKALHKDSSRRYRSVDEFIQDVRHYLEGRPVLAAPDRFGYRASRFLKRNALVSALTAVAALFLVAGAVISTDQARRADRRFQQVRQLANVFLFDFEKSIADVPGTLEARKMVASTAQRYLEQLAAESQGDSGLQREIGTAYERLGDIQYELQSGRGNDSEMASLRKAWEIRRALGDGDTGNIANRAKFIGLASRLAVRATTMSNASEAARWDEEATGQATRWVDAEPERQEALEAARAAYLGRAKRQQTAGQADRARQSMEKAVTFAERSWKINPTNPEITLQRVIAEYAFANMLQDLKETSTALQHAHQAVSLAEPLYRRNPANPQWRRELMASLGVVGALSADLPTPRNLSLSADFLGRAHSLASDAAREDPKNARAKDDLIVHCLLLARTLQRAGRFDDAARLYAESGQAVRELTVLNPQNRRYWYLLAGNQVEYGRLRIEQALPARARELLMSADGAFARGLALDPNDIVLLELRATQHELLALSAEKLGDRETARRHMGQCTGVLTTMFERDPSARSYVGDYKEMIALARRLGVSTRNLPD